MLDLPRGDVREHSLPCDGVLREGQRSSIGVTGASSDANAETLVTGTGHAPPAPADGWSTESGAMAPRSHRPPGAVARSDRRRSPLARGFPGKLGAPRAAYRGRLVAMPGKRPRARSSTLRALDSKERAGICSQPYSGSREPGCKEKETPGKCAAVSSVPHKFGGYWRPSAVAAMISCPESKIREGDGAQSHRRVGLSVRERPLTARTRAARRGARGWVRNVPGRSAVPAART
jgi:hypothetical protein